ncbi:MAG: cupin domain-containing protein [Deltaproteobacteria bacterium]
MPILRAEDAPSFALPNLSVTGLAAPSRGSRETSVWRITLSPGSPGVAHSLDREEIFVVLAGSATVTLGDERSELRAGDVLVVPPGQLFAFGNAGPGALDALAMAPVGIRAKMPDGEFFAPPWTE